MTSLSQPACSLASEQQRFESQCASRIKTLDALRTSSRFRRGLVINLVSGKLPQYRASDLGIGHGLLAAYRLHQLCRRLKRYCYVSVYDHRLERFFAYPDGASWDPEESKEELKRYPQPASIYFRRAFTDRYSNLSLLQATLESQEACNKPRCHFKLRQKNETRLIDAGLIRLTLLGWPPMEPQPSTPKAWAHHARLALATSLPPAEHHPTAGPPRCSCRYVTQPRLAAFTSPASSSPLTPWMSTTASHAAVHLRTNFADANETLATSVAPSPKIAKQWLDAACPDSFWLHSSDVHVFSDSPGLLREIRRQRGHDDGQPTPFLLTSKTWQASSDEPTRAAIADLILAGLSTVLSVAGQLHICVWNHCKLDYTMDPANLHSTSLYRALLMRSFCVRKVALTVRGCEAYPTVFVRDLPAHLSVAMGTNPGVVLRNTLKLTPPSHPCRRLPVASRAVECYRSWLAALK
jgi:hypothetical protein